MRKIFVGFVSLVSFLVAESQPSGWQNKDLQRDSLFGISTDQAYNILLKKGIPSKIIVAVIDSGIDTSHVDLATVLWSDSKTGIHGWNYIGSETGRDDITMLVGNNKKLYDSLMYTLVPESYRDGFQKYRRFIPVLEAKISYLTNLISELNKYGTSQSRELKEKAEYHLTHGLNLDNGEADTAKGNADVSPDKIDPLPNPNTTPYHGTHVAGIIGAVRNNGEGIDGIANHVEIMALKVNGNIRELRDTSLADAIRFAVDHGARIINISMGKAYTWNKTAVDGAVKYAMKKNVLIVHAAGNDGRNLDDNDQFPSRRYADSSGRAEAWIEVGASGPKDDQTLLASFSNYGKTTVDVFAPGINICSAIPGNKYDTWNGTSMAAPVVSGLAALVWGYYPQLKATQIKEIIMKSVVKRDVLKSRCVSGGVVNAYNALQIAAIYK